MKKHLLALITAVSLLTACSSAIDERGYTYDPWEPFNRKVFVFNDTLDTYLLKPLATGYDTITPGPVKKGVSNFFGNLGGVPVNLPPSIVELVEYDDSPGFDPEKLRTYDPPTRNYQAIIESLGFDFRNHDSVLYDRNDPTLRQEYDSERRRGGDDWVSLNISVGSRYGTNPRALDDYFDGYLELAEIAPAPYVNIHQQYHDLDTYINDGIDPETQRPFREHWLAEDMFVFRDEQGNVQTIIKCANDDVKSPPCTHGFNFPPPMKIRISIPPMKIRISMMYPRQNLAQWQTIQNKAVQFIQGFQAELRE